MASSLSPSVSAVPAQAANKELRDHGKPYDGQQDADVHWLLNLVGQVPLANGGCPDQQITQGFDNAANFKKDVVCPKVYAVLNCLDKLYVDVKRYTSFAQASANISKPIQDGKLKTDGFGHDSSGPGDIVVVRLMYEWPVYVSLFGFNKLADVGGNRLLMATVAFCNEPFGGTSKSC
jgi:hypothetical protein